MNSSPRARNPRPLEENPRAAEESGWAILRSRPAGGHVGSYNEITLAPPPLIYFDQSRAAELLEDVFSTLPGRNFLATLASQIGVDSIGVLQQQNQRLILSQLMIYETGLEVGGIVDLYQPDGGHRESLWEQFHPDQAVVIRGTVASAKDVQPSNLQLKAGAKTVRVYVERDHFLHLNQGYLTRRQIIAIGKVRSVPRSEIRAAAIGASANETRLRFSADIYLLPQLA